jgi:Fungal Zn(2)-Cys(6) binuclear cluster domain/Fungal specific transcription factor domain
MSLYPFELLGKPRASLLKVKTGCVNCKKRHLKCDESKPVCKRCEKSKRDCVYQNQQMTPSNDTSLRIHVYHPSPQPPPLLRQFTSENERCGFHSFRQVPAQVLGDALGWSDWGDVVLQHSDNDPALRHAVIALGIIYEDHVRSLSEASKINDQPLLPLAYRQYQQSIQLLRNQLQLNSMRSMETKMLSCMILIVFDFIQGNYRAATTHLFGGIAILRTFLAQKSVSDPLIDRISAPWRTSLERSGMLPTEASFGARLLLSYGYLDFWSSCWMESDPVLPEVSTLEGLVVRHLPRPDTELQVSFQKFTPLENRIREFLRAAKSSHTSNRFDQAPTPQPSVSSDTPSKANSYCDTPESNEASVTFVDMKTKLLHELSLWQEEFERARSTSINLEPTASLAANIVTVDHIKLEIMLVASQADGTMDYQSSTPAFKKILRLSDVVIEDEGFPTASPFHLNSPFAFINGIIHPLYVTALNCEDVLVCQKAIDILYSRHWKEGAWDSFVMGNIARSKFAERHLVR